MKPFRPWMTMPVYVCAVVTWIFFEYTVYTHPAMGFAYTLLGAIGEVFLGGFVIRDSVIHIVTLWQSLSPVASPPPVTSPAPMIRTTTKSKFSSLRTSTMMRTGVLCDYNLTVAGDVMELFIESDYRIVSSKRVFHYHIRFVYGRTAQWPVMEFNDLIHPSPIADIDVLCSTLVWDASRVAGRIYNHLPRNRADVIYAEAKRLIDAL